MKKHHLAALLAVLLSLGLSPALAGDAPALFTDVQFVGGPGMDYAYETMALPDGNQWIISGTVGGFEDVPTLEKGSSLGMILCLSPEGIVWRKTYGEMPGQNVVVRPALQPDGTIAIWNHHSIAQVMDKVQVLTLDQRGEELARDPRPTAWPDISPLGENFWIVDYDSETYLLQTAAGENLVTIPFETLGTHRRQPILLEKGMVFAERETDGIINERYGVEGISHTVVKAFTMSGGPLWQQELRVQDGRCSAGLKMKTSGGNLLALGSVYSLQEEDWSNSRGFLAMLDPSGRILWQQDYDLGGESNGFSDVAEVNGGYILLYTSQTGTQLNALWVDGQGNELGRHCGFRAEKEVYHSAQLLKVEDGLWFYGDVERKGQEYDILLMRLNLDALTP